MYRADLLETNNITEYDSCIEALFEVISMKIKYFVIILSLMFKAGLLPVFASQPMELTSYYSSPDTIQAGTPTTFTFIFNVRMDTTVAPQLNFKMPDDNNLSFPVYWVDQYRCRLTYSFPNVSEGGTADITLQGAKTSQGKTLSDIHVSSKVIEAQRP